MDLQDNCFNVCTAYTDNSCIAKYKKEFICRVSSILNNDVKNYGKQNMFDNEEDTCWNSTEGSPQWIEILFSNDDVKLVTGFQFQFQGGFVGKEIIIDFYDEKPVKKTEKRNTYFNDFIPEDTNKLQSFYLTTPVCCKFIRITFNKSTDFYGRIIIYKLMILILSSCVS